MLIRERDALPLVQKVGAKRHDALADVDTADNGGLLSESANLHGPEGYGGRLGIDDPHVAGLPVIIERAEWDLRAFGHAAVRHEALWERGRDR